MLLSNSEILFFFLEDLEANLVSYLFFFLFAFCLLPNSQPFPPVLQTRLEFSSNLYTIKIYSGIFSLTTYCNLFQHVLHTPAFFFLKMGKSFCQHHLSFIFSYTCMHFYLVQCKFSRALSILFILMLFFPILSIYHTSLQAMFR